MSGQFGTQIQGSTIIIAGLGNIGEEIARRAVALGMRAIGLTRDPSSHGKSSADIVVGLDEVVVCLPNAPATRGFVNALTDQGSFLINVGRANSLSTR